MPRPRQKNPGGFPLTAGVKFTSAGRKESDSLVARGFTLISPARNSSLELISTADMARAGRDFALRRGFELPRTAIKLRQKVTAARSISRRQGKIAFGVTCACFPASLKGLASRPCLERFQSSGTFLSCHRPHHRKALSGERTKLPAITGLGFAFVPSPNTSTLWRRISGKWRTSRFSFRASASNGRPAREWLG